ncbi:type II toxin-antitoxin system prevent-host-death family antitoxin [Arsenicitalea aurantiaca]|uniref:Type II toxin-antitoxin system prevent-host-death family antitoxin n=1 Tax=Arsenicitalea aurantiaca TaxID=1783274 RepID=A0A433XM11_9HYPH|nr:type II toxin-antitoxin system prevent-host-death family antitoxin [Arsenicitalea aurantiaca]RUT35119.1 type II toxin-antitoxin system prevent-host-death family antitoxin [Arsenicitalea aurantiaca]
MNERIEISDDDMLSALVARLGRGEKVELTRDGKLVAEIVDRADPPSYDPEAAKSAAARMIARRKGQTLGGITIRELIDEGRRY